ncbi:hypothetical protein OG223_53125 [Streptomyces sp. NBC_01478]|uniref:hypothetical protein n=1 Tax=Streptomyces sp. NBC_01478 TaxID=2903882 RepID=UPI002E2F325B|nr:hypothetical protein [Streptomyces sp. NBC_01478]
MTARPRPAPSDSDEITADLGIDDIILSYRSDYWITPRLDDGVQQWDIGMHFAEDGPGPQFGSIRLHLVDHARCLEPIDALDALSEDLFTIGQVLFDPSVPGVRQDLWDRLSVPGNTLIVDRVTIDSRLRGHGLGVFLTGMALDYLSSSTGVIALFPGPIERTDHIPHEEACARLGRAWSRLGFAPYHDGVWVLDPGLTTLGEAIAAGQQRLAGHRWRVALRQSPNGWGSDIAGITALMTESTP